MKAKTTTVTLIAGGTAREFEYSHAERLLRMRRSGWDLPSDSKFEFVNNALRRKSNQRGDK